ncbi:MAG: hypothetical protein IPO98_07115 [Saprospiraceae bacterium]|nr:hypothetical protein [Saprospiraceae bacterium]
MASPILFWFKRRFPLYASGEGLLMIAQMGFPSTSIVWIVPDGGQNLFLSW